jgi:hypothetical protein
MTDRRPTRLCSSQKKDPRPGNARLLEAVARTRRKQSDARDEDPKPYDPAWGWWIEERIARLENGQTWLIRIAVGALVAEIIRMIMVATGIGS